MLEEEISVAQATQFFQDQSHSPIWTFTCEDEIRGTASYHDGVLYIGSYDHNLYALEADNGNFIWKYAADGGIVSKPAINDDKVYFGSTDQYVHAMSLPGREKGLGPIHRGRNLFFSNDRRRAFIHRIR